MSVVGVERDGPLAIITHADPPVNLWGEATIAASGRKASADGRSWKTWVAPSAVACALRGSMPVTRS